MKENYFDGIPEQWSSQSKTNSIDWMQRALEAEALNERLIAEFNAENGPTFMGEPVIRTTPPVVQQGKQQDVNQIEAMVNLHDAAFVRGFAAGKLYGQANPEPQEPVAWMLEQGDVVEFEYRDYHENSEWTPLYTAPPSAALPVPDHLPDATKKVEPPKLRRAGSFGE